MKWTRRWICATGQGEFESWFRMIVRKFRTIMRNGLGSCGYYYYIIDFARPCKNGFLPMNWLSSCKMVVLLLNSRFLNRQAFGRPLRWCQMSTWHWPINRNLNISLMSFWILFIVEFSIFSLLIEFFIFHLFLSFSHLSNMPCETTSSSMSG